MLAGDIDIFKLAELISSVPTGCDISQITFDKGNYILHMVADSKTVDKLHYEQSVLELNRNLNKLKKECEAKLKAHSSK